MKVIGLAGWSGAGKTTLLTRVIPELVAGGLKVSTIKHAHHAFDLDTPGKDSWRHREAGASEVLVASSKRFALLHELRGEEEPTLGHLLTRLSPVDLLIVEGFKFEAHPKIEVHRQANEKPFLHLQDPRILGVVTDAAGHVSLTISISGARNGAECIFPSSSASKSSSHRPSS